MGSYLLVFGFGGVDRGESVGSIMSSKLTDKQKAFINYYLQSFNATDAARKAEYKGNDNTLRSIGSENLTKPNIKAEIDARMGELVMSANEALYELGQIARLDISEFLEFKPGIREPYLDLQKAKEAGLMRFVKKIKYNAQGLLEFELYDKQAALVQIGKWRGLSERIEHTGPDGDSIPIRIVGGVNLDDV